MPRKYSFESDSDGNEAFDNRHNQYSAVPRQQQHDIPAHEQRPLQLHDNEAYYDEPPTPLHHPQQQYHGTLGRGSSTSRPAVAYDQPPPVDRRLSHDRTRRPGVGERAPVDASAIASAEASATSPIPSSASPFSQPPPPPPHGAHGVSNSQQTWGRAVRSRPPSLSRQLPPSNVTPGADNFSEAAAGGMAGIAYSVAERNARESGLEAMRALQHQPVDYPQHAHQDGPQPPSSHYQQQLPQYAQNEPIRAYNGSSAYDPNAQYQQQSQHRLHSTPHAGPDAAGQTADRDSRSSLQPLSAVSHPPGSVTPLSRRSSRSPHSFATDIYTDDPYQGYSVLDPQLGFVNPSEIEDDGDDGLEYGRTKGARTSMLSLGGGHSIRSGQSAHGPAGAVFAGEAAGAGPTAAALAYSGSGPGGAPNLKATMSKRVGSSGVRYNAIHNGQTAYVGAGAAAAAAGGGSFEPISSRRRADKSEWLAHQDSNSKRWKWCIIVGVCVLVVAGIVCGVVFGVVLKHKSSGSGSSQTAAGDSSANGDLDINSAEIKRLLNNKNLHKVFPGIDYTPINTQYPACLADPPSQNNVTRDVAVLSQLTNTIRLYGTDCNQTEMLIHAIKQLHMQDTIKIWMGVWQDNNATTNARQLAQMWDIFDAYGAEPFSGVIVANEILFRKQMTSSQLGQLLASVRSNLTERNMPLPVATSDLGTNWDAALARESDYVMANIHPFFGGVNAKQAAEWTWNFWETNNGPNFKANASRNVISETGWPTQGGTDCGSGAAVTSCPDAAVAGIDQLNQFMDDWVCAALANGTQYFWFEAFDEPWKIQYDSGDKNWEDHWGIIDVNRNLKSGVRIPDCGGQTV